MDAGELVFTWPAEGSLSVAGLDDDAADVVLGGDDGIAGPPVTRLDVSNGGAVTSLSWLSHPRWATLEALILDGCNVHDLSTCPPLPRLRELSLNSNRVRDLDMLIRDVADRFPRLAFLSLMGCPCCPAELTGGSAEAYDWYALAVTAALLQLTHLDSAPVARHRRHLRATAAVTDGGACALLHPLEGAALQASVSPTTGRRPQSRSAKDKENECPTDSVLPIAERKLREKRISATEYAHIARVLNRLAVATLDDDDGGGASVGADDSDDDDNGSGDVASHADDSESDCGGDSTDGDDSDNDDGGAPEREAEAGNGAGIGSSATTTADLTAVEGYVELVAKRGAESTEPPARPDDAGGGGGGNPTASASAPRETAGAGSARPASAGLTSPSSPDADGAGDVTAADFAALTAAFEAQAAAPPAYCHPCPLSPRACATLPAAKRMLANGRLTQAEYDQIARVGLRYVDAQSGRAHDGDDAAEAEAERRAVAAESAASFASLLEQLEAASVSTAAAPRAYPPLTMEEERVLALALDRADAALAAEQAELAVQSRIVAIEQKERAYGLHDPSEHGGEDGGVSVEDSADARADGFSRSMTLRGLSHVGADRKAKVLTHAQLPPEFDLLAAAGADGAGVGCTADAAAADAAVTLPIA